MSHFSTRSGRVVLFVLAAAVCLSPVRGFSQARSRPIKFSTPRGATLETNMDSVDGRKLQEDLLKQKLQEDTFRPSSFLRGGDSLSGVLSLPYLPPSAPPVQSRHTRDLLDRQRNWIFLSPEDFAANPGLDDALGMSDPDLKDLKNKNLNSMERYYQRLEREDDTQGELSSNAKTKRDKADKDKNADSSSGKKGDETSSDPRVARVEKAFKRIFDSNPTGDVISREKEGGFLSDLLGKPDNESFTAERMDARKIRMDEFRQLLEPRSGLNSPSDAANALSPSLTRPSVLSTPPAWAAPVTPTLPTLPTTATAFPAATMGSTMQSVNASTMNQPAPVRNPFTVQPTYASPVRPVPKRQFY
jgi:hypothetical protein